MTLTQRQPSTMCGMTRNTAISVAGLHKSYGDNEVLKGVDLEVPEGSVYALLGPNGAGKTTVVNIITTLLTADAGEIRVAGYDVQRESDQVRRSIGVTGQFSAIDEFHTGRENLKLMADLNHLDRARAKTRHRRTAGAVRARGRGGPSRPDVLRRDEAPARPGDDPDRLAAADLPRRADHGAGPAQPARDVADRPGAGRRRCDGAADHAVPRRGRPAGPPGGGARRRPDHRRGNTRPAEEPGAGRARGGAVHRRGSAGRGGRRTPGGDRRCRVTHAADGQRRDRLPAPAPGPDR